MTGVPGGAWMMTGVPGEGWMTIEDLGGIPMMIEFPGAVQMMTGGLGETWMTIGFPGGVTTIGFPGGVMTQDLVPGDPLSSQVDGERKKEPEKKVGVHLGNPDPQKTVNGIGKKRETEIIKIVMRTKGSLSGTETERGTERGTETEMGIERIASDDQGMKVAGEEDQLRNPQAGEMRVVVTIGIEMTAVVMIAEI